MGEMGHSWWDLCKESLITVRRFIPTRAHKPTNNKNNIEFHLNYKGNPMPTLPPLIVNHSKEGHREREGEREEKFKVYVAMTWVLQMQDHTT